jgi:hypothetical protein
MSSIGFQKVTAVRARQRRPIKFLEWLGCVTKIDKATLCDQDIGVTWCDLAALALAFHILSPRLQAETVDTPIMGRVVPGVPLCFLDLSCRDRMGKPQSQCKVAEAEWFSL